MKRLQFSHYDERFREEVWRSALKAYNSIKEKDRNGKQPLYRPKNWQRTERKKIRRAKKEDWYKKGGNKTVIFVPSTPLSQLSKRYQEVIGKTNLKIKVVERSGKTVKSILQESDPYKQPGCSTEEDCMLLRTISSLHEDMKGTVQYDGPSSDPPPIKSGAKQGCVPALTLFGILFSLLLRYAFSQSEEGIYLHTISDSNPLNPARLILFIYYTEWII
ncbi:hypothetical protein ACOMHN_038346 [Nucella lapillus]